MRIISTAIVSCVLVLATAAAPAVSAEYPYSLNLYTGRMTSNHWEDFFLHSNKVSFKDSYLTAVTLARTVGKYRDRATFEIEGQVVKHFDIQKHWEFNLLGTARWNKFWWKRYIDTSVAFGVGPSYATDEPEIEIRNDGKTSRFLVYWMMELALAHPKYPRIAFITRIHHRSDAFGLVAEEGGSNALVFGLKYRF